MGFMDKAKKLAEQAQVQGKALAEQAQTKIDEVQNDFNSKQSANHAPSDAGVEYDKHGRPSGEPAATTAPVDGAAPAPPAPMPETAAEAPDAPAAPPADPPAPPSADVPSGDPLAATPPPAPAPLPPSAGSGMTSGDPLAG